MAKRVTTRLNHLSLCREAREEAREWGKRWSYSFIYVATQEI